jgi:hypothetical protein
MKPTADEIAFAAARVGAGHWRPQARRSQRDTLPMNRLHAKAWPTLQCFDCGCALLAGELCRDCQDRRAAEHRAADQAAGLVFTMCEHGHPGCALADHYTGRCGDECD